MEPTYERIGNSHPAPLSVRLHIIFLAADVEHHLTGLRSLDTEICTSLLVHLRELIAGNGCLCDKGILRNFYLLWHLDIRTLRLIAEESCYSLTITATQLTIACRIEMQTIRTVATVIRRDHLCCMQGLGEFVDLFLTSKAYALTTSLDDISRIEVHILWLQLQVATEMIIHLLHHSCPLRVTSVCLTLMHQDALDDTILLSLLG